MSRWVNVQRALPVLHAVFSAYTAASIYHLRKFNPIASAVDYVYPVSTPACLASKLL
jgi:hypothetical protein